MAPPRRELNKGARNDRRLSAVLLIQLIFGGAILILFWFSSSLLENTTAQFDVPVHAQQDLGALIPPAEVQPIKTVVPLKTKQHVPTQTNPINSEIQPGGLNSRAVKRQKLRFDWTNLPVQSKIAKLMLAHQTNCSLPLGNHNWRKKIFGLGSDLHVWGAALCNSIEEGNRIRTHNINPWVWIDQEKCDAEKSEASTMSCYFPHAEMQCPGDRENMEHVGFNVSNPIHIKCNRTATSPMNIYKKSDWRAAGIEMLFSRVAPIVQEEGERQLNLVFPDGVPSDLITVHIRWGDKKFENKVMGVSQTMNAIKKVRTQRGDNLKDPVSILLCTEDPKAVDAFKDAVPANWNVYIDQFYHEMIPFRPEDESIYNKVPKMSRALNGKTGLWSLGSLLVSMEANAFVLVLSSNWSRVMDELRRNVLNPRCRNCTFVVDVAEGKWKEW
jgi:hypothetical protein